MCRPIVTVALWFPAALCFCAVVGLAALPAMATDVDQLAQEAEIVADAANALVARDQPVPDGVYPAINAARSANPAHAQGWRGELMSRLAGYRQELDALADNPGAFGGSVLASDADLIVGQTGTLTQTYTVGGALQAGASILVASHWSWPFALQNVDADEANYVTASVRGRSDIALKLSTAMMKDTDRWDAPAPLPVFEVAGGTLAPGDVVEIDYRNFQLPTQATNNFVMPLYVRDSPEGHWNRVPGNGVVVLPGAVDEISMALPFTHRPGDPMSLQVRMSDAFGNLAIGDFPSLEVLVNGDFRTRIPAGTDPVPVLDLTLNETGLHKIEVKSAGGGLDASAQVLVEVENHPDVRFVELHAHTSASDVLTSADEVRQRYVGLVDDVVLLDHDDYLSPRAWLKRQMSLFDGFVWSGDLRAGGQAAVLFRDRLAADLPPRAMWPTLDALEADPRVASAVVVALPEIPADRRYL
ncbi:MAG: hypothetical protein KDI19_13230, partial [Pseudomonadales bacterium]|nr:hypothetical protein [Pseudomonadales bacterium]